MAAREHGHVSSRMAEISITLQLLITPQTMAVNVDIKGEKSPLKPLRYVANMFLDQTLQSIKRNLETQHVWPVEIYPGFTAINEMRRRHGQWHATGDGVRSFEGTVVEANESTGIVTLSVRYNDYMQYVDIGVGAGRKSDDVDRSRKVNFRNRYSRWVPDQGKSHRPAILPTLRHLATRLQDYTAYFYGTKFEYDVYETFEGLTITV